MCCFAAWPCEVRGCIYVITLSLCDNHRERKVLRAGVWKLKAMGRRHRDETFYCTLKKKRKRKEPHPLVPSNFYYGFSCTVTEVLEPIWVVWVERAGLQLGQSSNSSLGHTKTNNLQSHLPLIYSCRAACLGMRRKLMTERLCKVHIERPRLNLWHSCGVKTALWMQLNCTLYMANDVMHLFYAMQQCTGMSLRSAKVEIHTSVTRVQSCFSALFRAMQVNMVLLPLLYSN